MRGVGDVDGKAIRFNAPTRLQLRPPAMSNSGSAKFPAGRTSWMVVTDRIQPYTRGERPQSSVGGVSRDMSSKARLKYGMKFEKKRAWFDRQDRKSTRLNSSH